VTTRRLTLRFGSAGFAALAMSAPAPAHDRWVDGSAVPAWVARQCCGPADAHHLRPDQVHRVADGYAVDGYKYHIPEPRLDPSPDGEWWLFYRTYPDGDQSPPYCFFGPAMGS
jgi:hypothetical protein